MNSLDIIILVVIVWFAFFGLYRGLVRSVLNLVGVICALFFATLWLPHTSSFLQKYLPLPDAQMGFIAFVALFILIVVAFRIAAKIIQEGLKLVLLGWVDRVGGLLFGFLKGALLVSALLWVFALFPQTDSVQKIQDDSQLSPWVKPTLPLLYDGIVKVFPAAESFSEKMDDTIEQTKSKIKTIEKLKEGKEELLGE